jgi:hypothetical protein
MIEQECGKKKLEKTHENARELEHHRLSIS